MHVDLCGPMEETDIGGYRFFMLMKGEATSFCFIYLLKSKDEFFDCLSSFIPIFKNINGSYEYIKYFRFDNGIEFANKQVNGLLSKYGIQRENIVAIHRNKMEELNEKIVRLLNVQEQC